MSFDNSRTTFNPKNDYSGVVMEQGRVQTDADWNEWLAELARRTQAGTLDTLGRAVYPATTPNAFKIGATTTGATNFVQIGCGRMYVDGLLVENHGDDSTAVWDPALAEMSNAPQPPPTSGVSIDFGKQPYNLNATVPSGDAQYVAYLDVWRRPVTYIEDSSLVDPAIGVDTSGRLQTAWKVGLVPITPSNGFSCSTPIGTLLGLPTSIGTLSNDTVGGGPVGPCCLTTGSGYTGVENQFYRVEIHTPGEPGKATFKWSRENASVQTGVTGIANGSNTLNKPAMVLTVQSLGRDQVLGFSAGDWIELTNQTQDNACLPGELYKIDHVDVPTMSITLTTEFIPGSQFSSNSLAVNSYTRIIRWDQAGKLYTTADSSTPYWDLDVPMANGFPQGCGGIPVPSDGSSLVLENGITVAFSASSTGSSYLPMNYWNFAARTATGKIDLLNKKPPQGIYHHYTTLSVVTFSETSSKNPAAAASECRTEWPPSEGGGCGCCTFTVGDNKNSFGMYTSINAAIKALPHHGGEICILPGEYFEDVLVHKKRFVVIHGCGWQTHIYSAASNPNAPTAGGDTTDPAGGAGDVTTQSGFTAVFTVVECQHVELNSFCVHAAEDEVGILLDRTLDITTPPSGQGEEMTKLVRGKGDTDISLEDLVITATNRPAILAESIQQLEVIDNRILMSDVESIWGAVYLNGDDMLFKNNQVSLTNSDFSPIGIIIDRQNLTPVEAAGKKVPAAASAKQSSQKVSKRVAISSKDVTGELDVKLPIATEESAATETKTPPKASGGIHIAGPSKNVFVVENEIQDGSRNGITLGNFILLDQYGNDTGMVTGLRWEVESECSSGGSYTILGSTTSTGSNTKAFRTGAGGVIQNVHIDRNLIRNMGMCGIGPVGFFDLKTSLEVIGIENLSITANVISNTMQRTMEPISSSVSPFGYGAISLPDVNNLAIRDNIITNFGVTPGAEVCGIFVLHGELVEISRNQIRETRDLSQTPRALLTSFGGERAGILIHMATPPAMEAAGAANAWETSVNLLSGISNTSDYESKNSTPLYAPGLPALRIQENVVRVAIGMALSAQGYGPFSISNNHFGSGGAVPSGKMNITSGSLGPVDVKSTKTLVGALTVGVLNLGLALEGLGASDGYRSIYAARAANNKVDLSMDCGGAVLFTNNICQLEAWGSGVRGISSVGILSLDHILFANNHLWLDGRPWTAFVDALLLGVTVQAGTNRLQEGQNYPVIGSGFTYGLMNATSHNISTYCLWIQGPEKIHTPNLMSDKTFCPGKRDQIIGATEIQ